LQERLQVIAQQVEGLPGNGTHFYDGERVLVMMIAFIITFGAMM